MMNFKPLLFIAFLMTGFVTANAQQRNCELAVTLLSPAEGATIPAYAQYNLTVRIVNNGPNDLIVGDTLWYNTPTIPLFSYNILILQQPIVSGNSADIVLETDVNNNTNTEDQTVTYYATVLPRPDTLGAVRDGNLANNTDANNVIIKPCETGTAVNNVNAKDLNINIYPNPAIDMIQVKSPSASVKQVMIADISGRMIFSDNVASNKKNTFELNIAPLHSGMYFLKMETDKGTATTKFIKQ